MRINVFIFIMAALAAAAIGCNKASAPEPPFDPVVRVAPEVTPQTRGSYTTENLKEFDLFIHSANSRYSYTNTKFTKNATSGEWEPARQMLWAGKNVKFAFLAIAPSLKTSGHSLSSDPICEFTVEYEQTKESNASDLLWAGCRSISPTQSDAPSYFTTDGVMKFEFDHALTLLRVKLTLGTEFNHNGVPTVCPVSDVRIDGFPRKVRLTPLENDNMPKLEADGDKGTIQAYESKWERAVDENGKDDVTKNCMVTYECIVVPDRLDSFTVNFICNGKPYTYTATGSFPFMSGNSYTLPLTVGKDEVIMSKDGITASPWVDGGNKDIETD